MRTQAKSHGVIHRKLDPAMPTGMQYYRVKAGALQFTMFITVVIALLLAGFVILVHTHKLFRANTHFVKETIGATDKGIHYMLSHDIKPSDTILLNDEDDRTLKVYADQWGIFTKLYSSSRIQHKTFKKIALVGASQPQTNRTALYLEDQNRPLVVVGNTRIQGDAYLPKQGVRTGNISGHSYYGSRLIYGKTKTSKALPIPTREVFGALDNIKSKIDRADQNQFLDLNKGKTFQNSFYNAVNIVYSPTNVELRGVNLSGHIIVQSDTKITVDATTNLSDIMLIAPEIEIKDHTKGSFQALATKSITVGSHCKLYYPTALVLKEDKKNVKDSSTPEESANIRIGKGTQLKGVVAFKGETKNYKPQVFIEETVEVMGEVHCDRNVELLGRVYGSIYASGFVASQSGSVYQNHIYNGTIEVDRLPEEYVGLLFEGSKKHIAKWLY